MRIFAPPAVRSQVLIVDFDATVAMREVIPALIPAPEAEQTTSLAAPLDLTSQTPWESFASRWLGKMDGVVNGVGKAAIRGDRAVGGGGMLGLASDILGWMRRPSAEKVGNVIVVSGDGVMEWTLRSDPPAILTRELGDYYSTLPMQTTAS